MPTLRCASTILTIIGCHRPSSWTSEPIKFLYKMYRVVILILVQILTLVAILDIVLNVKTQDEFSDNLVLTIPMLITCSKFCSFLAHGNNIMFLINILQQKPYSPENIVEEDIETKFDKHNERVTALYTSSFEACIALTFLTTVITNGKNRILAFRLWLPFDYSVPVVRVTALYTFSTEACIVMILLTALIVNGKNKVLAYRSWIPFDYSAPAVYAVIFALQGGTVIISSLMNVTYDVLFSGLMFCIHSQLEILGLRLKNVIKNGKESARECARHHNFLYEFAAKVNEDFQAVLCIQFMASIAIICFTLYRITQTDLGERLAATLVYGFCMLMQIFYYCWYGNEVKRKSLEIPELIFTSNWANLDDNTKKTLMMIMVRATFPIEFTTAHILSVNIDSFMAVLKTSYSVYNVLSR